MHFRYSSGYINSVGDFFIKGIKRHLKGLMLLMAGFVLLKLIGFIYAKAPTSVELSVIFENAYCIFATMLYLFYLYIAYRRERYISFSIKDDIIYEYFKDKEINNIKITSLHFFKLKAIGDRVNFIIFYKKTKFDQLKSFGLIDPSLSKELENYFFSKNIEKWAYDRIK